MPQAERSEGFHIAIVGNVGTGKSTLARLIRKRTDCLLYLEDPRDYPFLRLFFVAPHAWGFANELQFIITKFAQQAHIRSQQQRAVQEMHALATHAIWTPMLHEIGYISQAQMAVMDRVFEVLAAAPVSVPDLTVILQASVATLVRRIKKRGRDYEEIDPQFARVIEIVDRNLARFVETTSDTLLLVDTETLDFTKGSAEVEALLDDILGRVPCT